MTTQNFNPFLFYSEQLHVLFTKASKQKNPALWLYANNARTPLFMLEALTRIHDKAFDRGLITLSNEFAVVLSAQLLRSKDAFVREVLVPIHGKQIELPERFLPSREFIEHHRTVVFANEEDTNAKRG